MTDDTSQVKSLVDFLRAHDIAALATIKEGGVAHATTIFYYAEEDLKLYFLTKYDTLKFINLKTNNNVGLVVTDEKSFQTVQIEGIAKEVDYAHEYEKTVKKYIENQAKNGRDWEKIPINHITAGYYSFVQISPTWVRWIDFNNWNHLVKFEQHFS
jgi:general stress protein 26